MYLLAMPEDLEHFWRSQKELAIDPNWKRRGQDEYVRLVSPLDIDGITVEGLRFTMSAHIYTPDRWVTFQIEYESLKHPRGKPMARFEWRPRSPHNNKNIGPKELRMIDQVGSHLHGFEENWQHSNSAVQKGLLPISIPVTQPLESYHEALDYVEKTFRINGVSGIAAPPWMIRIV